MCLLCTSLDFENNFILCSLAKDSRCTHKISRGVRNTMIKTYILHNIIFNNYIIVILHKGLNFIDKLKVSIQSYFPSLCFCEYPSTQNHFFSMWSPVIILKTKGINSCEAKPMALSDWITILFSAGWQSCTVLASNWITDATYTWYWLEYPLIT